MNYFGTNEKDVVTVDGYDVAYLLGGNDIAFKSSGSGWVHGGSGTDWLSMYYAPTSVVVNMYTQKVTGGPGINFQFTGFEKISGSTSSDYILGADAAETLLGWAGSDLITGGGGNDNISGHEGNDRLHGGEGHDKLNGGGGDDQIFGNAGNDRIDGGAGFDTVVYSTATAGVSVNLANTSFQYLGASEGSDLIANVEAVAGSRYEDIIRGNGANNRLSGDDGDDIIYGRGGSDDLAGGAGQDRLDGQSGNDVILGGEGDDDLYGGSGSDTFEFYSNDTGDVYENAADVIWDFDSSTDAIRLESGTDYEIWERNDDHVVSWYDSEGWHDVVVKGDDPTGSIETDLVLLF